MGPLWVHGGGTLNSGDDWYDRNMTGIEARANSGGMCFFLGGGGGGYGGNSECVR